MARLILSERDGKLDIKDKPAFKFSTIDTCLNLLLFIVLMIFLNGCIPCYYAPNAQNVPVFSEKGQGNGTFSFQFGPLSTGWNVQGALAVSNHIGIMGNYNHYSGRDESGTWSGDEYYSHFKSNMGEFGLGYYTTFENKFVFESYGGIGGSRVNNDFERWDGDGSSSVGTTSFFIQPSMGYYKKHIRLAFSTRFRLLDFRDVKYQTGQGSDPLENLDYIENMPVQGFFEPAFTFRAGGEMVKFQVQAGFSIIMSHSYDIEYDPVNINIGIVFCLPDKKKSETVQ